jgi:pimeloyl-ACP methyl ester carboxylesterase
VTGDDPRLIAAATGGLLPESVHVQGPGLALRCLVWGRAGDPTAVLVHGNGAHAHWWDPLVPALVPGWRLVVPDLRGHGESERPSEPRYHVDDHGRDLRAVIDALAPGPVALVGHSMGGRVVVAMAAAEPPRALAVLDSRLEPVRPAQAARWRGRLAGQRDGKSYPSRAEAMAAFRFVPDEADVPEVVRDDLAFHAVVERGPSDWTYRFDRAVLALEGDGARDLLDRARRIDCPTLVLAGESSWVMDAAQRAVVVAAMPQARIVVFPGGHHFLVAHPGPVGAALRGFLDGTLSAGDVVR